MFLFILQFLLIQQSIGKLIELSEKTIGPFKKSEEFVLIEFITKNQCPYCDDLHKEMRQLSMFVKIPFGFIDCSKEIDYCERENITALPFISMYKNEEEYRSLYGMHDYGEVKHWMLDMMLPVYVKIKNETEFESYKSTNYGVALFKFPSDEIEKEYREVLIGLANKLKRFKQQYLYMIDSQFEIPTVKIVTINKEKDTFEYIFELPKDKQVLHDKLILGSIPPMSDWIDSSSLLELVPHIPILHYYYDTRMLKTTMLQRIAQEYTYTLPFVVNKVEEETTVHGHSKTIFPCLSIMKERKVYPMDETMKLTEENVKYFISSFFDGKIQSVKKERTATDTLLSHIPPIITSDIFTNYTDGDSAIIICSFRYLKCGEYVNTLFKALFNIFQEKTGIHFGAVDQDEDDILSDRILTTEPIVILTSKEKKGDDHIKLFKPTSFDPIEVINEINKFCKSKIDLTDEEVIRLRETTQGEVSVYHTNTHLHNEKEEL